MPACCFYPANLQGFFGPAIASWCQQTTADQVISPKLVPLFFLGQTASGAYVNVRAIGVAIRHLRLKHQSFTSLKHLNTLTHVTCWKRFWKCWKIPDWSISASGFCCLVFSCTAIVPQPLVDKDQLRRGRVAAQTLRAMEDTARPAGGAGWG